MKGYDEYNTILLPPRGVTDKLPVELLDFYEGEFKIFKKCHVTLIQHRDRKSVLTWHYVTVLLLLVLSCHKFVRGEKSSANVDFILWPVFLGEINKYYI